MPWSPDNPYIGEFEDLPVQMLPRSSYFAPAEAAPLISPTELVVASACQMSTALTTVENTPMPTTFSADHLVPVDTAASSSPRPEG